MRREGRKRVFLSGALLIALVLLLITGCSTQKQTTSANRDLAALIELAKESALTQQAGALLKVSGANPNWQFAQLEQYKDISVLAVPLEGRTGSMLVSFKNGQVLDVNLALVNDSGITTYLDLGNQYGLRLELSSKTVLSAGRIPELIPQNLTPIDEIEFLPDEELAPQGYYDPTGCVPDALYERWISAHETYENAKEAFLLASEAAAAATAIAAGICATAETGITAPSCVAAMVNAANAAAIAAYQGYKMRQAAQKVRRIKRQIEQRIEQCKKRNRN